MYEPFLMENGLPHGLSQSKLFTTFFKWIIKKVSNQVASENTQNLLFLNIFELLTDVMVILVDVKLSQKSPSRLPADVFHHMT